MTAETITALVNFGAAGAVIIITVYFLRFIARQNESQMKFYQALMDQQNEPMSKLAQAIEKLLNEFQTHDVWEHTKLDEMSKKINPPKNTQRRRNDG